MSLCQKVSLIGIITKSALDCAVSPLLYGALFNFLSNFPLAALAGLIFHRCRRLFSEKTSR